MPWFKHNEQKHRLKRKRRPRNRDLMGVLGVLLRRQAEQSGVIATLETKLDQVRAELTEVLRGGQSDAITEAMGPVGTDGEVDHVLLG